MATKKSAPVTTVEETPEQPQEHALGLSPAPAAPGLEALGALGKVIGDAVAHGITSSAPPRKMTIGEYVRRGQVNQYHPNPPAQTPQFDRDYFQNGHPIEHATTYDREVELLNQITHSGRYINRLVEVVVVQNGSDEVVDIRFSNKRDKAFELKGHARDFTHMLEQIVEAQKAERADIEDDKAAREERRAARAKRDAKKTQPSFGRGKASREARERVGA